MEQYELPDGWVWAELQEIVEFGSEQVLPFEWPERLFNYLALENIEPGTARIIDFSPVLGSEIKSNKYRFTTEHVLYGKLRPYLRKAIAPDFEGISATDLLPLKPLSESINRHFLVWWLLSPQVLSYAVSHQTGVKMPRLRTDDLERMPIALAPTDEQRRIAEKIEALFEQSRTAREALDAIPALLRQFRQAVLAAAFRGELSTRDPNDEPASALLERILAERRRHWEDDLRAKGKDPRRYTYPEPIPPNTSDLPELPEGWCYTFLQPLLSLKRRGIKTGPFGSLLKKDEHRPEGIPVFGIENIGVMRFVPGSKIYITQEKAEQLSEYDAQPGDVLISRSGTVGEVCVVPSGLGEARISTNLMRVVLEPDGMLPAFFCLVFNGSQFVLDQIVELCKGSTREFLNQEILLSIIFPLPPLPEQQRIVSRVQLLFAQADIVEVAAELARHRLDRLDQSILARAFRGELVPQDPDDEPASVLLERIHAGRAQGTETRLAKRARQRRNRQ
jgi:type I restriction enzyme S subunit